MLLPSAASLPTNSAFTNSSPRAPDPPGEICTSTAAAVVPTNLRPLPSATGTTPSAFTTRSSTPGSDSMVRSNANPVAAPGVGSSNAAVPPDSPASANRVFTSTFNSPGSFASFASANSGRKSKNRAPSAATRSDQSFSPSPVTDRISPAPFSPTDSTSGRPCSTRNVRSCSLVISVRLAVTRTAAVTEKNNGTSFATGCHGISMTGAFSSWALVNGVSRRAMRANVFMGNTGREMERGL